MTMSDMTEAHAVSEHAIDARAVGWRGHLLAVHIAEQAFSRK